MSADWGSFSDWFGGGDNSSPAPTYDYSQPYSQPTYDYTNYDSTAFDPSGNYGGQPAYNYNNTGSTAFDPSGNYGGQPAYDNGYGGLGTTVDDNGNPMPVGIDANGNPVDSQGNPLPMNQGGTPYINGSGQGQSGAPRYGSNPMQQAGPPNPYPGGQSPNYNYPGGMNNPYGTNPQQGGQSGNGGLLGSLFGGGGNTNGSGGGGLFGGSTGSDLLTLLGVGGALAFLPKLLNSASGGSSGTTVTAPDYSAQWRNLPALPNYTPQFAQAGTNPGMQMSANPFGGAAPAASGPVAPTGLAQGLPPLFPGLK